MEPYKAWNHTRNHKVDSQMLSQKGWVSYTSAAALWPAFPLAGKSSWLSLSFNSIKGSFSSQTCWKSRMAIANFLILSVKESWDLWNLHESSRPVHPVVFSRNAALSDAGSLRGGRTSPPIYSKFLLKYGSVSTAEGLKCLKKDRNMI